MKYRIKEHRVHAGMTQQELADKAGCSRQFINMLENSDEINMSSEALIKIAKALGTQMDELIFFESDV